MLKLIRAEGAHVEQLRCFFVYHRATDCSIHHKIIRAIRVVLDYFRSLRSEHFRLSV
jgi:hypothetical protein